MDILKATAHIKDQLNVQGQHGNWNYDPYMHGLYNGLECALATIEEREPQYRKPPTEWLKDHEKEATETQVNEASRVSAFKKQSPNWKAESEAEA